MALFVATIDAGSLSRASRNLGLSLSSVSRHLSALEERIGTRLVVRTTRALALTEAGRTYYEAAKRITGEIDDLEVSLTSDVSEPSGRLSIYLPTLFGRVFILPILTEFMLRYPAVTLDVMMLDRSVNVVDEGIDLAVRIGDLEDSSLFVRKLGSVRWVVCAAPAYLEEKGTPEEPANLAEHDCLLYCEDTQAPVWPMVVDGKLERIRVSVRMRSNTLDSVVAAAIAGAGIVYAPAWFVTDHVAQGRLKVVMRDFERPPRPINAVFTHGRLLSAKVRALLDCLVEHLSHCDLDEVPHFGSRLHDPSAGVAERKRQGGKEMATGGLREKLQSSAIGILLAASGLISAHTNADADEIIPIASLAGTVWAATEPHDRTTIGADGTISLKESKDIFVAFGDLIDGVYTVKVNWWNVDAGLNVVEYAVLVPEEENVFDYIEVDDTQCEREPLELLAADGQLMAYKHYSFWQCMDTLREKPILEPLYKSGNAPWVTWE